MAMPIPANKSSVAADAAGASPLRKENEDVSCVATAPDEAGAIERPMKSTLSAEPADVDAGTAVDVAVSPGFLTQGDA